MQVESSQFIREQRAKGIWNDVSEEKKEQVEYLIYSNLHREVQFWQDEQIQASNAETLKRKKKQEERRRRREKGKEKKETRQLLTVTVRGKSYIRKKGVIGIIFSFHIF